jgi:hypothetical protein
MDTMPRPRPPHLLREVSRHGTVRWVVRVGHGPRIPIEGEYGSAEFMAAYHAAIRGETRVSKPRADEKSLRFLAERWQASSAWAETKLDTRQKRVALLKHVLNSAGNAPYKSIAKAEIVAGRERRAKTPAQANNFLAVMRALFKWAVDNNFLDASPTDGVRDLKRPNAAAAFPFGRTTTWRGFERAGHLARVSGLRSKSLRRQGSAAATPRASAASTCVKSTARPCCDSGRKRAGASSCARSWLNLRRLSTPIR